jgi:hypothetical protein
MLAPAQIDMMRYPAEAFFVQQDADFLRARGGVKVKQVQALPALHFAVRDLCAIELHL